jgi:uncharacterized BrkB/YihY/UPF0761 family membrane protein
MQQPPQKINATGGIFAALIVVFIFGFFIGLPILVGVLLIAAFVGLWVATAGQRLKERAAEDRLPDRPWRANRNDEK